MPHQQQNYVYDNPIGFHQEKGQQFYYLPQTPGPRFCKGKTEVSEVNSNKINYTVTSLIASVQQNQQYENDVFGEIGAVSDSQSISSIALCTKIPWLLRGYR